MQTTEQQVNSWYGQFKKIARENGIDLDRKEDLSCVRLVFDKVQENGDVYSDIMAYIPHNGDIYYDSPEKISPEWQYEKIKPDNSQKMKSYLYKMAKEGNLFLKPFDREGKGIMISVDEAGNNIESFDGMKWGEAGTENILPMEPGQFEMREPYLNIWIRLFRKISQSFFKETYEQYKTELHNYNVAKNEYNNKKANYKKMRKVVDAFERNLSDEWYDELKREDDFWKKMHFMNDINYKSADKADKYLQEKTDELINKINVPAERQINEIKYVNASKQEINDFVAMVALAYLAVNNSVRGKGYKNYTSLIESIFEEKDIDEGNDIEYSEADIKEAGRKAYDTVSRLTSRNTGVEEKEELTKEINDLMREFVNMNKMLISTHNGLDDTVDFYVSIMDRFKRGSFIANMVRYGDNAFKMDELDTIRKYENIGKIRRENRKMRLEVATESANYKTIDGKKMADVFSRIIAEKIVSKAMSTSYNSYVNTSEYQNEAVLIMSSDNMPYDGEYTLQAKAPVSPLFKEIMENKNTYYELVDKIRKSDELRKMVLGNDAAGIEDSNRLEEMLSSNTISNAGERCERLLSEISSNTNILKRFINESADAKIKKQPERTIEKQNKKQSVNQKVMH